MPLKTAARDFEGSPRKGRGATDNREGRYERQTIELEDDGWAGDAHDKAAGDEDTVGGSSGALDEVRRLPTIVTDEQARSLIQTNQSPDAGPGATINPYRGCEHGLTVW